MDEIDRMKQFKKAFKYINILFLILVLFSLICDYIFNSEVIGISYRIIIGLILVVGSNIFFGIIYGCIWLVSKLTNMKIDINLNKEYIREIPNEYPPALVSMIYDKKTEVYRDYTATILNLYTMKYIDISGFNDNIIITKGENEKMSNLMKHELYVYNCIVYKQSLDEKILKNLVIEDAIEKGTIKKIEIKNKTIIAIILTVLMFLQFIIPMILSNWGISEDTVVRTFFIGILVSMVTLQLFFKYEESYKLTSKGKKELKKIKSLKNFIKDYTLIEQKEIDYIQILEKYIPYSLSLGVSPQVEEYIKENEIYRNLIYEGRGNWI